MTVGDTVEDMQPIESGKTLKIKPTTTSQEWIIHNIYREADGTLIKVKLFYIEEESVGVGDGITKTFTLGNAPIEEDSETIYINGLAQSEGYTIDYESGQITFDEAPENGAVITATYWYKKQIEVDSQTGNGGWLFFAFHVTWYSYLMVRNDSDDIALFGYDGVVTKG